jgi:hypothetical protein
VKTLESSITLKNALVLMLRLRFSTIFDNFGRINWRFSWKSKSWYFLNINYIAVFCIQKAMPFSLHNFWQMYLKNLNIGPCCLQNCRFHQEKGLLAAATEWSEGENLRENTSSLNLVPILWISIPAENFSDKVSYNRFLGVNVISLFDDFCLF